MQWVQGRNGDLEFQEHLGKGPKLDEKVTWANCVHDNAAMRSKHRCRAQIRVEIFGNQHLSEHSQSTAVALYSNFSQIHDLTLRKSWIKSLVRGTILRLTSVMYDTEGCQVLYLPGNSRYQ